MITPALANTATNPTVFIHDGKAVTTSKDVAEYFGKEHQKVVLKISTLDCSEQFLTRNFSRVQFEHRGNTYDAYEMTKDGFVFLVMGFTGKKAAAFKESYIGEFNRMESSLNSSTQRKTTTDDRTPLRDAINLLVGKKGIMYPEAYSFIHQRFNVAHIDELPAEKLPVAIEYVHRLVLEGEFIAKQDQLPSPATKQFTDEELLSLCWLWSYAHHMADYMLEVEPILRAAEHRLAGAYYSMPRESIRVRNAARRILQRETSHVDRDQWADGWRVLDRMRINNPHI